MGTPEPLEESIRRLQAYADAERTCSTRRGPRERAHIKAIIDAVSRSVSRMGGHTGLLAFEGLAEMGARRVSVGAALARAAWTGFIRAARLLADEGSFDGLEGTVTFADLNGFFGADRKKALQ